MKKILFLFIAATISLTAISQGNSHGHGNGKGEKQKHDKKYKDREDGQYDRNDDDRRDDERDNRNRDDRRYDERDNRNRDNRDNNWNNNHQNGKYSKNTPAKVRDAFYRDYPNSRNVSWTKSQGVWTAHFGNGLFNRSVSYRANGQRVGSNNDNRRNSPQDNRTGIDKIFKRGN